MRSGVCEGLPTDGLSCGDPSGDQSEKPPWDASWAVATQRGTWSMAWRRKRSPTEALARAHGPPERQEPEAAADADKHQKDADS